MADEPVYHKLPVASPYDSSESDQVEIKVKEKGKFVDKSPAFWINDVRKQQKKLKNREMGTPNEQNVAWWLKDSVLQAPNQAKWQHLKIKVNFKDMDEQANYKRVVKTVGVETKVNLPWPDPEQVSPGERRLKCLSETMGHPKGLKYSRFWEDLIHRKAVPFEKDPWKNQRIWASVNAPTSNNKAPLNAAANTNNTSVNDTTINNKGTVNVTNNNSKINSSVVVGGIKSSDIPSLPTNQAPSKQAKASPEKDRNEAVVVEMALPDERNWDNLTIDQQRQIEAERRRKSAKRVVTWVLQSRFDDPFAYDSHGNPTYSYGPCPKRFQDMTECGYEFVAESIPPALRPPEIISLSPSPPHAPSK